MVSTEADRFKQTTYPSYKYLIIDKGEDHGQN